MGADHGLPWGLLGWRVPVSFGRFSNMDYYILESRGEKTAQKNLSYDLWHVYDLRLIELFNIVQHTFCMPHSI